MVGESSFCKTQSIFYKCSLNLIASLNLSKLIETIVYSLKLKLDVEFQSPMLTSLVLEKVQMIHCGNVLVLLDVVFT